MLSKGGKKLLRGYEIFIFITCDAIKFGKVTAEPNVHQQREEESIGAR